MRVSDPRGRTACRCWSFLVLGAVLICSGPATALAGDVYTFSSGAAEATTEPAGTSSVPSLAGSWRVQRFSIYENKGKSVAIAKPRRSPGAAICTQSTLTLFVGSEVAVTMSYTLDPSQMPCTIDMKSQDGVLVGICRQDGNSVRIRLNNKADGRPCDFDEKCDMSMVLRQFLGLPLFVVNADGTDRRQIVAMPEFTTLGSPDWSCDGTRIAFDGCRSVLCEGWDMAHMFVADVDGRSLKDLGPGCMPSWSLDDKQLTYSQYGPQQGIWIMNADGSGRRQIDSNGTGAQWSPTCNEIAYAVMRRWEKPNICVHDLATGRRRLLLDRKFACVFDGLAWSPDGKWICCRADLPGGGAQIIAVSAEGEKRGLMVLLPNAELPEIGLPVKAVSCGGTGSQVLVSVPTGNSGLMRLYSVDLFGTKPPQLFPGLPADWQSDDPAWSPDGKKVAFSACPPVRPARPAH